MVSCALREPAASVDSSVQDTKQQYSFTDFCWRADARCGGIVHLVCVCVSTSRLLPGRFYHAGKVADPRSRTRQDSCSYYCIKVRYAPWIGYRSMGSALPLLVNFGSIFLLLTRVKAYTWYIIWDIRIAKLFFQILRGSLGWRVWSSDKAAYSTGSSRDPLTTFAVL